jgi:hypothetical protein
MMRIFHSGGSILTGTELAAALLNYSRALANRRQADVVDIPILNEDGSPAHAQVLIGYCSPLVGVSSSIDTPELTDPAEVEFLYSRAAERPVSGAHPISKENMEIIDELSW